MTIGGNLDWDQMEKRYPEAEILGESHGGELAARAAAEDVFEF